MAHVGECKKMRFKTIEEYEIAYDLLDDAVEALTKRAGEAEKSLRDVALTWALGNHNGFIDSDDLENDLGKELCDWAEKEME